MAITWQTPKTNWYGATINGMYSGDRFNYTDYNRIKNNIEYLREIAQRVYDDFDIIHLSDKNVGDYPYADEINTIESNLETLNKKTGNKSNIGSKVLFQPNSNFIDYKELNRIEKATLSIYERLNERLNHRRQLSVSFEKGGMSW